MSARSILVLVAMVTIVGAAPRKQFGPIVGDEYLHGVLMHGDTEAGDTHEGEDLFRKLQEKDREAQIKPEDVGPKEAMEFLHGVLMHGDEEQGVAHMHQDAIPIGPEKVEKVGPVEAMEFLHGVSMHGDSEPGRSHDHEHEKKAKATANPGQLKSGPRDAMEELHGVLMHGDEEPGDSHSAEDERKRKEKEEEREEVTGKAVKVEQSLESAMHGSDDDHVHDAPRNSMGARSGKPLGIPSITDPHEVIHGDMDAQIQLGEAPPSEQDEFKQWQDGDTKKEDPSLLGFTFPFITDSLINEIDVMKRRWLAKFWGGEEDAIAFDEEDKSQKELGPADVMDSVAIVGSTDNVKSTDINKPPGSSKSKDKSKTLAMKRASAEKAAKQAASGSKGKIAPRTRNDKRRMHDES